MCAQRTLFDSRDAIVVSFLVLFFRLGNFAKIDDDFGETLLCVFEFERRAFCRFEWKNYCFSVHDEWSVAYVLERSTDIRVH